jgi:hypothetical protein
MIVCPININNARQNVQLIIGYLITSCWNNLADYPMLKVDKVKLPVSRLHVCRTKLQDECYNFDSTVLHLSSRLGALESTLISARGIDQTYSSIGSFTLPFGFTGFSAKLDEV